MANIFTKAWNKLTGNKPAKEADPEMDISLHSPDHPFNQQESIQAQTDVEATTSYTGMPSKDGMEAQLATSDTPRDPDSTKTRSGTGVPSLDPNYQTLPSTAEMEAAAHIYETRDLGGGDAGKNAKTEYGFMPSSPDDMDGLLVGSGTTVDPADSSRSSSGTGASLIDSNYDTITPEYMVAQFAKEDSKTAYGTMPTGARVNQRPSDDSGYGSVSEANMKAQATAAALAYGTETIKSVNKVFGPGNRYVTEAKKQLSQQVAGFAIDMPAGPSELLIIGDSRSNPAFIAADLLSQAEHGIDSQVILLTDSNALIDAVNNELDKQVVLLSRQKIAKKSLAHSRLVLVNNIEQAIEVSNEYGPEHLIIQTQEPQTLLARLRNAGSIFVGAYTPESAGDYASGTNHVLPTYGYSKVISSLSLADFSRRYTVQELTREGLASLADCIIELTDAEGLDAHQRAVTIRLEDSK